MGLWVDTGPVNRDFFNVFEKHLPLHFVRYDDKWAFFEELKFSWSYRSSILRQKCWILNSNIFFFLERWIYNGSQEKNVLALILLVSGFGDYQRFPLGIYTWVHLPPPRFYGTPSIRDCLLSLLLSRQLSLDQT